MLLIAGHKRLVAAGFAVAAAAVGPANAQTADGAAKGPARSEAAGLALSAAGVARSGATGQDEAYVILRDSAFGTLKMEPGSAHVGQRLTLGGLDMWPAGVLRDAGTPSDEEFRDQLTYYTPWLSGLKFGLSYRPGAGTAGDGPHGTGAGGQPDGVAFSAKYDRAFERLGVGVRAGYATLDGGDEAATPDLGAWSVAARLDLGGWLDGLHLSGAFTRSAEAGFEIPVRAKFGSNEAWNIGARYLWGRNDVSLAFGHGETGAAIAAPGEDMPDAAMVRYARTFDRGIKWSVNLYWADAPRVETGGPAERDGMALTTGLRLNF